MLEGAGSKKLNLDFEIYNSGQHADRPDIISVVDYEGAYKRSPNLWVEVKGVKSSNRWIGLSTEQIKTIRHSGCKDSDVFLVYTTSTLDNGGRPDILEAFLSHALNIEYNSMASQFSSPFSIKILAVLTLEDLVRAGAYFKPGRIMWWGRIYLKKWGVSPEV